jgi:hypothetical protein
MKESIAYGCVGTIKTIIGFSLLLKNSFNEPNAWQTN